MIENKNLIKLYEDKTLNHPYLYYQLMKLENHVDLITITEKEICQIMNWLFNSQTSGMKSISSRSPLDPSIGEENPEGVITSIWNVPQNSSLCGR